MSKVKWYKHFFDACNSGPDNHIMYSSFLGLLFLSMDFLTAKALAENDVSSKNKSFRSFDKRPTLSHQDAVDVYNKFAVSGHIGGKDSSESSGYGGPAVKALVEMAGFGKTSCVEGKASSIQKVFDYGCGQGKLAEYVLSIMEDETNNEVSESLTGPNSVKWHGVDQSPEMIARFKERFYSCASKKMEASCEYIANGDAAKLLSTIPTNSYDRFISTYCLDLLSEEDMYKVLTLAEHLIHPEGEIILAGITYGWKDSVKTFLMTLGWNLMYRIKPKVVGGCRPQNLIPYVKEMDWEITKVVRTKPQGFPWMMSEIICARPKKANE